MASTVPAKSQPLHNFTLPHLKWNKDAHSTTPNHNSNNHHHRRRSVKSPSRRPNPPSTASPLRHSPLLRDPSSQPLIAVGLESESPSKQPECARRRDSFKLKPSPTPHHHLPSRDSVSKSENPARIRGGASSIEHHRRINPKNSAPGGSVRNANSYKSEAKSKSRDGDGTGIKRSKILIKIPCNKADENPTKIIDDNHNEDAETDEPQEDGKINNNNTNSNTDEEIKTWNLRPRKPIRKSLNLSGGISKSNGSSVPEKNKPQSPSRNLPKREAEGPKCGSEKRKLSISVALTKDEIEDDIFALTGSKPARRPKKRAKIIQKQVDAVFPGMWLLGINADSYKVSENSVKVA